MKTLWHVHVQIPLDHMFGHHLTQINVYKSDCNPSSPTAITLTREPFIILDITYS